MAATGRKPRRGNRAYVDPHGDKWDSEFEYRVYVGLQGLGYSVRRCRPSDTLTYYHEVKGGRCLECGSENVVQVRTYTPDLYVVRAPEGEDDSSGYFIECKGYFPAHKRSLLRSVKLAYPDLDLRVLFSKEAKLTPKKTNVQYTLGMIKTTAGTWNNGVLEWSYR